jgi:hypothetical protein
MTSWKQDLLLAYGLSPVGLSPEAIDKAVSQLQTAKKTTKIIEQVWRSDRYPYTIMLICAKFGMYIPPVHRVGMTAYKFFLRNIRYYEAGFSRKGKVYPTPEELFLAKDRVGLLMQFRDDEILRAGVKWDSNYSDRRQMLIKLIEDNISVRGEFAIESNSRSSYSPNARIILYSQGQNRLAYTIQDLGRAVDTERKVVLKSEKEVFDSLSLLQLRCLILEKFGQWKDRVGYVDGPPELLGLVQKLDEILDFPSLPNIGAYLSTPT